ncbi:hypothetical protein [Ochrobactrum sp. BTU1]|jgi:hypothetical protein|uniref:hypothetical protein n=1 Tax=Ochrobactrum sp. BTU1 TaxID=2840456 RepID=UPI001C03C7A6|nr:hypothetical protein KMS41_18810 [Ochrobactrum sp. BTU1]
MTEKPRLFEERVRDGLDMLPEPVDLPVDWLSCHDFPRPSLKSASGRAPESSCSQTDNTHLRTKGPSS